jgi:hypothetical protein
MYLSHYILLLGSSLLPVRVRTSWPAVNLALYIRKATEYRHISNPERVSGNLVDWLLVQVR